MTSNTTTIFGHNGMVATSQTLATTVGLGLLERGGSAVDAAIGANAMLALCEPHMCGPGGDLFAQVWDPRDHTLSGLNASGRSAAAVDLDAMRAQATATNTIPTRGGAAITAPGAVDGWCVLHDRFGRLPMAEILAPAADYARRGVPVGVRTAQWWRQGAANAVADPLLASSLDAFRETFLHDGRAPVAGERMRNTGLAVTFEAIGRHGRDGFYAGACGEGMLDALSRSGSGLTAADLARAHADWVEPLRTHYRGYDVFELPPNGQGLTVIEMLNVLEGFPLGEWSRDEADYWHVFIEAKKLAYEDRARYYADPAFVAVPVAELASTDYGEQRRAAIDLQRAAVDPVAGSLPIERGDTTYLCVADGSGMMVSLIQSLFQPFGAGVVPAGFGFALQGRGVGFALEPSHPNCYAPGKRPFHTIIPAFAMRDGRPWLSFGVMGADMQPQGQVQILNSLIDFDLSLPAAAAAPRMRHFGGSHPSAVRESGSGAVHYEEGIALGVIDELERRGHHMVPIEDWVASFTGGFQAVRWDAELGVFEGASEPRLDGCAIGY